MKGTPLTFFELSLAQRIQIANKEIKPAKVSMNDVPLEDLIDSSSFLEHMRNYLLFDLIGKYKVF